MQSFSFLYDIILQDRIKMIGKNIRQARFIRWRIYVFNKKKKKIEKRWKLSIDCLKIKFWNRVSFLNKLSASWKHFLSYIFTTTTCNFLFPCVQRWHVYRIIRFKASLQQKLKDRQWTFPIHASKSPSHGDLFVTIFRFEFDNPCRDIHWSSKRSFHVPCCARESWI